MKWIHSCLILICCLHASHAQSFTVQNKSELHLFDQKWEFEYVLDLNEYFNTNTLLEECMNNLKFICNIKKTNSCNYFTEMISNVNFEINSEIMKIQSQIKRKKRELVLLTVVIVGVLVMSLIAGVASVMHQVKQLKTELKNAAELLNNSMSITNSSVKLQRGVIDDTNEAILIIDKNLRNITQEFFNDQSMNNVVFTVIFQILNFQTYQRKLNLLFTNKSRENLFEIIDFRNLSKTIDYVNNEKLPTNLFIPQIKLGQGNELTKAFWNINATHLSFNLHLPVLRRETYILKELVPIPTLNQNNIFILNFKPTKFVVINSQIYNLTNDLYTGHCVKQDNLTACNSMILNDFKEVSPCAKQLIQSNANDFCLFRAIEYKNYILEVSRSLLYAFIVKPMNISIQCMRFEKELFLNGSRFLPIASDCAIFERTNFHLLDQKTTFISAKNAFNPKFSFKPENKTYSMEKIPVIGKYEQEYKRVDENLQIFRENISKHVENIDNINTDNWLSDIWTQLKNSFSNTMIKFITYVLICLIMIQLCVSLVGKIISTII